MQRHPTPMTERDMASSGPRALKDPGSVEYAWQTVSHLKLMFQLAELSVKDWEAAVADAQQHKIYDRIPPEKPYDSMDALLTAEIGETTATSVVAVTARQPMTHAEAGQRGGRGNKATGNTNSFNDKGNTVEHHLGRLERDRPDLYRQVLDGALTANAAAVEAGFRTRTISVPLDPERAASILVRRFKQEGRLDELLTALTKAQTVP